MRKVFRRIAGPRFAPFADLLTLESAAAAVGQGRPVRAEGRGAVESRGLPVVMVASSLKFEVDG